MPTDVDHRRPRPLTAGSRYGVPAALRPIVTNAGWLIGARLAGDGLSFVFFAFLSRSFGPSGVGSYAYAFAIAGLAYVLAKLGFEDYGVRELSGRGRARRRVILRRMLSLQVVIIALIGVALLGLVSLTAHTANVALPILYLSAFQLSLAVARTLWTPAHADQEMWGPALTELAARVLAMAVGFGVMITPGGNLPAALAGFPLAAVALTAAAFGSAARRTGVPAPRFRERLIARTFRSVWPFAAAEVVWQLFARADLIIIMWFLGASAAGLYAGGLKLLEAAILPIMFLGVATFPSLSEKARRGQRELGAAGSRLLTATAALGGVAVWGLVFVAPPLLVPVLGSQFAASEHIVRALAPVAALLAVEVALVRVLLAGDLQLVRLRVFLFGTIANVALNAVLVPVVGIYGAVAASISCLAAIDLGYLFTDRFSRSISLEPIRRAALRWAGSMACGALVGLSLYAAGWPTWAAAVLSLVVYLGVLALLERKHSLMGASRRGG